MFEYLLVLLLGLAATAVALAILRRVLGRPRARWARVLRTVLVGLVCVAATAYVCFRVSRTRRLQLIGRLVTHVETRDSVVALTFDDGPTPEYADSILAVLRRERARATFYVLGGDLERHPELGRRIVADGHVLGNHTWSHPRMVGLSLGRIRREVEDTDRLIRVAGERGPIHFRAPYSHKFVLLPWYLHRTGRTNVSWDVEPDGDPTRPADEMVRRVLDEAHPGAIILLHPWYPSRTTTRQALPGIIRGLRARGYELVTVPELLRRGEARGWR
ncbi:MAG TPA: polysaccharide deacetylase family protein [Longimicrobium sp.]|nr:polysaccharide deacetylase family protein [Longimicrobium sp.]